MDTVGGYRLVRKLGAGKRAEIYLGHAGSSEPPDGDRIVAIKIFHADTEDASIDREIEALARASSRHLLELKDLATGPDGRPCLILPRLGSGTLARLMARRYLLAAGEAVSILTPLIAAVRELHRVGVVHGALAAGAVLFDERGAPVLTRFGAVTLVGDFPAEIDGHSLTPAQLDEDPGAILDRIAVRQLIGSVLDHLDAGECPDDVVALRDRIESQPPTEAALAQSLELIFDLAPALPIRFDDEGEAERFAVVRSSTPDSAVANAPSSSTKRKHGALPAATAASEPLLGSSSHLSRAAETHSLDKHPLALLRSKARALLAPVRIPVWITGGAGLGALVIALTVIPAAHSGTGPLKNAVVPSPSTSVITPSSPGTPTSTSVATAVSAIEGEDPLAAARALIAARARCFATTSPACFDSVDQAGSAVIEADRDLFRRTKKGVPLPPDATLEGFTPRLIQQLGDSAIIQLVDEAGDTVTTKNPAPLLLVRSEAGWRIRDLALG